MKDSLLRKNTIMPFNNDIFHRRSSSMISKDKIYLAYQLEDLRGLSVRGVDSIQQTKKSDDKTHDFNNIEMPFHKLNIYISPNHSI